MVIKALNLSLRLLLPVMEQIGTARSLAVAILLRHGDWKAIVELKPPEPGHYLTAEAYFRDCQATQLLRKLEMDLPGVDRVTPTIAKWLAGEKQCYQTNERLSGFEKSVYLTADSDLAVYAFIGQCRKIILSWIGAAPPSLDTLKGRFGPKSTYADIGKLITVPDKMTSNPTLTSSVGFHLLNWVGTLWATSVASRGGELSFVRGNRFATVPKTALIDRSIAVEPSINVYYQLGYGQSLRKRLRSATGWDLGRAQDIHRQVAKENSVLREFATLDLSNASDTVSTQLVRLLLPSRWFRALDSVRSKMTYIPEGYGVTPGWRKLEKFSSMGNGFTFELETIIFAAIATAYLRSCGKEGKIGSDLFVYGDDIILPDDIAPGFESVLRFFGFSLNKEKSYWGPVPFRESCGADYHTGFDVRPYSIKEPYDDPWKLLPDINGIRRFAEKLAAFAGRLDLRAWHPWVDSLPDQLKRCRGPSDLGDAVIHDSPDRWKVKWKFGIRYIQAVKWSPEALPWYHWKPDVQLACATYGYGDGRLGVIPPYPSQIPSVGWVPFS
jgi:hypothetical protein